METDIKTYIADPISKRALKKEYRNILLEVHQTLSIAQIAQRHKTQHSTILEKINWLIQNGFIVASGSTRHRLYSLTERAINLMSAFFPEGDMKPHPPENIRAHDLQYESEIRVAPQDLKDRLKANNWIEFTPKNWVGYKKNILSCLVVFTPLTVQYIIPPIHAASTSGAEQKAIEHLWKVKAYLEAEYPGLKLGSPKNVATCNRQHIALQNDPLAIEYAKAGHIYKSDRLHIGDQSEAGKPETEAVHKVHAKNDLDKITKELYEPLINGEGLGIKELTTLIMNMSTQLQGLNMLTLKAIYGMKPNKNPNEFKEMFR